MSKRERVSICLDDLFAASKAGHPAIKIANNGKKYAAVDIWHNDQPDTYGNDMSVSLYDKEQKKATYIGNGKYWRDEQQQAETPKANETQLNDDGLPFN